MRKLLLKFPKITGPLRAYYNLYFGEKELAFIKKYLQDSNRQYIFFDIGSNYGIYAFLFGRNAYHTFILEPISECIEYIKSGYRFNNATFINKAASNKNKEINLNIPKINSKQVFGKSSAENKFKHFETRIVKGITIDSFSSRVDSYNSKKLFIKVDVEGYENKVIDGALNILSSFDAILLIEIEKRHNADYLYVFSCLKDIKYKVFCLENKNLKELFSESDIENAMQETNNFIFKNY